VIYAKAEAALDRRAAQARLEEAQDDSARLADPQGASAPASASSAAEWAPPATVGPDEVRIERTIRIVAIPAALLVAWLALSSDGLRMVGRIFMSMWVHELGHATAAWLCGFVAIPGPWFTSVGESRSVLFALMVTAAIVYLGLYGLQQGRRVLVALAGLLLLAQIAGTLGVQARTARMLFTFGGDGGALILSTLLMATMYAHPESRLRTGWLRWGFLVIGAVAFMDVVHTWFPARTDFGAIPFGRIEGTGLSDASVLVETYGWDERALVMRHIRLAWACLLALGAAYVFGLWDLRRNASEP
jgi:hypothetical protein